MNMGRIGLEKGYDKECNLFIDVFINRVFELHFGIYSSFWYEIK